MSYQDYRWNAPPPPSNGNATAALVLGICGIVVCPIICSILAIVFAKMAYREIDASGGHQGGRGNAQAGLVLGWVGLALWGLGIIAYIVLVVVVFSFARDDGSVAFDAITPLLAR